MIILGDCFALDRETVRTIDTDGHLHVSESPISKATVNPYRGSEIPNYRELGLDGSKIYYLLRDPGELEKAAHTFNGKPLLNLHRPQTAEDHDRQLTVGSVNNVRWHAPYLMGRLDVWDGSAIDGIQSGEQKQLSSGYRYRPDMTPGIYEGQRYDGVMRDIQGNHIALVEKGRAGPDVIVGDSEDPTIQLELLPMATKRPRLSPRAAVALGALTAHVTPKLAQDAKIDLRATVADVTAVTWKSGKPKIAAAVVAATKGKLAQDADLGDIVQLLDKLDCTEPDGDEPVMDADPAQEIRTMLEGKVSPEEMEKICSMVMAKPAIDAAPSVPGVTAAAAKPAADEKEEGVKIEPNDGKPDVNKDEMVSKTAMDAAITAAVNAAQSATMARLNAIAEAKESVRPFIGSIPVAMDSAPAVYKLALDHFKTEGHPIDLTGLPQAAYGAVFRSLAPSIQAISARPAPRNPGMAVDAASVAGFATRFPNAAPARSV